VPEFSIFTGITLSIFYNNLLVINIQKHAKGFIIPKPWFSIRLQKIKKTKCSKRTVPCSKVNKTNNDAKKQAKILIVDDQEEILFRQNDLEEAFEEIFTTNDPKKIITILGENQIDVVMLT
jgi:PleD family two-component response regulator